MSSFAKWIIPERSFCDRTTLKDSSSHRLSTPMRYTLSTNATIIIRARNIAARPSIICCFG
jgi:hypothetical protein